MATKYERLQALTVKKEVKQGVFVYTPLATFLKAGIVLPYDEHFEIGEINEKITLQIHPNIIQEIIDATVNIEDIFDGSKVVGKAEQDQLGNIINFTYSTKSELLAEINKLINGTTLVDKAKKDQAGNVIDDTYASKIGIGASTSPTDKKLTIRLYTPNQDKVQATPNLSSVTYTIDSATETLAGLMKADDKVKLNALPSHADLINEEGTYQVGISKRAIKDQDGANIKSTYETKANANAQVGDLQGQINQIKGVPHSYGEIQKTNAEITADKTLLTIHVESIKGVAVVNGDLVYDLDNHEWEYNGTTWVDNGEWKQTQIATASEVGVVKGSEDILIGLDGSVEVVKSRQADVATKDEDNRDLVDLELTSEVDRKLLDYATIDYVDTKVFVDADEFAEVKTDKADKVEVRSIGEEIITYANGKVSQVESNTILTEVFYDFEGNIDEVHETYKIDNKKYKTTFEKDANGRVNKITKGEL